MSAVGVASRQDVLDAFGHARSIAFAAWTVREPSTYLDALEAAGDRGARVDVFLEKHPWLQDTERAKELARQNAIAARHLRKHHVRVHQVDLGDDAPMHLKGAIVDGTSAYLDDHNWRKSSADGIVRTDRPEDVAMLRSALAGRTGATGEFSTRKDFALALEASVIEAAPKDTPVYVSSETFDHGIISDALRRRALRGEDVEVIADGGCADKDELAELVRSGVQVRLGDAVGKACITDGAAWIGSANATNEKPQTVEWGLVSTAPDVAKRAHDLFSRAWESAKQFSAA